MKITYFRFIILTALTVLSGCTTPGIPELYTSSINEKTQKEGVDYKLITINRESIANQKTFDQVAYINKRKKRRDRISSKIKQSIISKNTISQVPSSSVTKQNSYKKNHTSYSANTINTANFLGITSKDSKKNYHYRVGKNDILSITVWEQPELSIPNESFVGHVVSNDGKFYFPYAGKIQAAGKTIAQIRKKLEEKLKPFTAKPQVDIRVTSFRSQKAYITGAIQKTNPLEINDTPLSIRDAISKSGGLKPYGYTGYATLVKGNKNIPIDLNRMLKYNDNRQNFLLRNGDRLHIIERDEIDEWRRKLNLDIQKVKILSPVRLKIELDKIKSITLLKKELEREQKLQQSKVFVMGEVHKPGSIRYQLEDGITLAEAINDSGSFKEETVNPRGIFVVRKENNNDQIPTVYQLPIVAIQSMFLAEQFNLHPRDIVYITATPSIRWNRVLSHLIPTLTVVNAFK